MINKHEKELQCFQQAVKIALKKQGETRRLMKYLDGKDVFRREEERPDIVKLCSKQQKNVLVGIEHFRVDHLSIKKKDNKIASTGVVAEKEVESIYQKWHEEVMKTGNVPTEAVEAIANLMPTYKSIIAQPIADKFLIAVYHIEAFCFILFDKSDNGPPWCYFKHIYIKYRILVCE